MGTRLRFAHGPSPTLRNIQNETNVQESPAVKNGDVTATDMINTLQNWADINDAGAMIQISGTTATVHQVCTPSCESSINASSSGGLIAGTFLYSTGYS